MDDDTGEFPVPVLVPRDELEALARLILDNAVTIGQGVQGRNMTVRCDSARALLKLVVAARRVLPSLPAVDSVDRE